MPHGDQREQVKVTHFKWQTQNQSSAEIAQLFWEHQICFEDHFIKFPGQMNAQKQIL